MAMACEEGKKKATEVLGSTYLNPPSQQETCMRGRKVSLVFPRCSRSRWIRVDTTVDADSRFSGSVRDVCWRL